MGYKPSSFLVIKTTIFKIQLNLLSFVQWLQCCLDCAETRSESWNLLPAGPCKICEGGLHARDLRRICLRAQVRPVRRRFIGTPNITNDIWRTFGKGKTWKCWQHFTNYGFVKNCFRVSPMLLTKILIKISTIYFWYENLPFGSLILLP